MRLLRLDLKAFGPFTGASLDFSAGAPGGLHIVYGPNEAGKSSSLRAVRDLLYGFEHRTPDAHLHRSEDLRIGGLLSGPGGEIYVQRLKRRKDSLLDERGEPLDEARLRKLLGGVDRETFTRSFGLDHAELELHGERMLRGEASVGETLFDAGTGGVDVRRLLETLKSDQDKLYRPRGKGQEINRLLEEHAESRRRSQEVWLLPESFQQQVDELEAARAELARVTARADQTRTELYRLRDLKKALPALERRAECLAEIAALGSVVLVPEAATERRERAESRAAVARANAARLEDESARAERRLAEIEVPAALLAIGQARVSRLADAPGSTRKAREDLPRIEADLRARDGEARTSLRRLGRGEARVRAEEMRLSAAERAKIRELSTEREKLDELRRGAVARQAEIEREADERRARLMRLPAPRSLVALERVASLSRSLGDVQAPVVALETRRAELLLAAEAGLRALVPRCDTLAALAALALPSVDALARFADEEARLLARAEALAEARRRCSERAVEADAAIQRVHAAGSVPSEGELHAGRAERNAAAGAALSAWRAGAPFAEPVAARLGELTESSDGLADRLWREADRVAALGHAQAERELVSAHAARLAAEHGELAAAQTAHAAAYRAACGAAQAAPLPAAELRSFAERRARVLALWDESHAVEPALARAREQHALLAGAVTAALGPEMPGDTLSSRVERCAAEQAQAAELASERRETEHALDTLAARLAHEQRALERAESALAAWRAAWALAVRPLNADAEILPVAALELLDDMASLAERLERIEGLERRVNGIKRDEAALAAEVGELAREHGIPFDPGAPDAAAEELVRRYRRGESARDERARIEGENAERGALLRTERAGLAEAERELFELSRDVGAASPSELPALEAKSRRARELAGRLADLVATLVDDSGGRSVTALVAEAEGQSSASLSARLDTLSREVEELEEERAAAMDRAASIQAGQSKQSAALGAEAAQEEQTLGAALAERVERYATLRVATALLERSIERYRVENQAPILKRAGELFPRLTDDGYTTLRVGREERGIVAVRTDGSELAPHELSTGTRYQLYLALRLASVERFIAGAEALPLVLDDVTVHVDDARKSRTFAVLADIATRVQILFFTHHARDAELALAGSGGRAVLHELTRRAPAPTSPSTHGSAETAGHS